MYFIVSQDLSSLSSYNNNNNNDLFVINRIGLATYFLVYITHKEKWQYYNNIQGVN